MAEHRAATDGPDLVRAGESLGPAPAALAPAVSDPAYRVLVGDDGTAVLLRRQWTPDGIAETVLLAAAGIGPDTPAVLTTAVAWGCDRVRDRPGGRGVVAVPPAGRRPAGRAALPAPRGARGHPGGDGGGPGPRHRCGHGQGRRQPVARRRRGRARGRCRRPRAPRRAGAQRGADRPAGARRLPVGGARPARRHRQLPRRPPAVGVLGGPCARRPRPGSTVVVPTAPSGGAVAVPASARRVRVTGCTAVEPCLVADGSAAAWHDLDRSGTHVHDVAGGLALVAVAGGVALTPDGTELELRPDTGRPVRFAAAESHETAEELLRAFA